MPSFDFNLDLTKRRSSSKAPSSTEIARVKPKPPASAELLGRANEASRIKALEPAKPGSSRALQESASKASRAAGDPTNIEWAGREIDRIFPSLPDDKRDLMISYLWAMAGGKHTDVRGTKQVGSRVVGIQGFEVYIEKLRTSMRSHGWEELQQVVNAYRAVSPEHQQQTQSEDALAGRSPTTTPAGAKALRNQAAFLLPDSDNGFTPPSAAVLARRNAGLPDYAVLENNVVPNSGQVRRASQQSRIAQMNQGRTELAAATGQKGDFFEPDDVATAYETMGTPVGIGNWYIELNDAGRNSGGKNLGQGALRGQALRRQDSAGQSNLNLAVDSAFYATNPFTALNTMRTGKAQEEWSPEERALTQAGDFAFQVALSAGLSASASGMVNSARIATGLTRMGMGAERMAPFVTRASQAIAQMGNVAPQFVMLDVPGYAYMVKEAGGDAGKAAFQFGDQMLQGFNLPRYLDDKVPIDEKVGMAIGAASAIIMGAGAVRQGGALIDRVRRPGTAGNLARSIDAQVNNLGAFDFTQFGPNDFDTIRSAAHALRTSGVTRAALNSGRWRVNQQGPAAEPWNDPVEFRKALDKQGITEQIGTKAANELANDLSLVATAHDTLDKVTGDMERSGNQNGEPTEMVSPPAEAQPAAKTPEQIQAEADALIQGWNATPPAARPDTAVPEPAAATGQELNAQSMNPENGRAFDQRPIDPDLLAKFPNADPRTLRLASVGDDMPEDADINLRKASREEKLEAINWIGTQLENGAGSPDKLLRDLSYANHGLMPEDIFKIHGSDLAKLYEEDGGTTNMRRVIGRLAKQGAIVDESGESIPFDRNNPPKQEDFDEDGYLIDQDAWNDAREPWEVPLAQYVGKSRNENIRMEREENHEEAVYAAMQRGIKVPDDVLDDYPHLVKPDSLEDAPTVAPKNEVAQAKANSYENFKQAKAQMPDTLIAVRLGDFYEFYEKDAEIAASELGITLTGREFDGERVPMAGVPYHSVERYLAKLVQAGKKVALLGESKSQAQGKSAPDAEKTNSKESSEKPKTSTNNNPEGNAPEGGMKNEEKESPKLDTNSLSSLIKSIDNVLENGTAAEVRAAHKEFRANKDAISAMLSKAYTIAKLKRILPRVDNKAAGIKLLVSSLEQKFSLDDAITYDPFKESMSDAIARQVDTITDEKLQASRDKARAKTEARQKALANPETLEEFQQFIRANGREALSAEQKAKYDDLRAKAETAARQTQSTDKSKVEGVQSGTGEVEFTTKEGVHTKTKEPIFIVQASARVSKETYQELKAAAKKLGGYYSSFGAKENHGFIFRTQADADAFAKAAKGETVEKAAKAEAPGEKVGDRLRSMADKMEDAANKSLEADRRTGTSRQARMAASAEATANGDIAFAKTLRQIADAIDNGDAEHLAKLTTKAQLEQLQSVVQQAKIAHLESQKILSPKWGEYPATPEMMEKAEFPWPFMLDSSVRELIAEKVPGTVRNLETLRRLATKTRDGDLKLDSWEAVDALYALMQTLGKKRPDLKKRVNWAADPLRVLRLRAMGIETPAQLRAATRELLEFTAPTKAADPIKQKEMELKRMSIPGYFPTPKDVVARMMDEAEIKEGMSVLEPSAGKGDIAQGVRDLGVEPAVVEFNYTLQDILKNKGFNLIGTDALDTPGQYDRIVMNPPFENGADMDHVRHAFDVNLSEGGRIVAIMSEGSFFRSDKKATAFREWLDSVGGTSEKLPEGSFKASDNPTGVNTRIVVINKPAKVATVREAPRAVLDTVQPSAHESINSAWGYLSLETQETLGGENWKSLTKTNFDTPAILTVDLANSQRIANEGTSATISTPERLELRKNIVKALLDGSASADKRAQSVKPRFDRQVYIVMGNAASGKSSNAAIPLAEKFEARIIDSDDAKAMLPEYEGGTWANYVHQESAELALMAIREARQQGMNVVYPIIGKDEVSLRQIIAAFEKAGYDIHLTHVMLDPQESARRSLLRFEETGRAVTPNFIINQVGNRPAEVYGILKSEVKSYAEISTNVKRGEDPNVVEATGPLRLLFLGARGDGQASGGNRGDDSGAARAVPEGILRRRTDESTGVEPETVQAPLPEGLTSVKFETPRQEGKARIFEELKDEESNLSALVGRMNPNDIEVRPGMQYKAVDDPITGTDTSIVQGVQWNKLAGNPLSVWLSNDGRYYVMNGHHRRMIAINSAEPEVAVHIYRESEGVTEAQARGIGALDNILDGKGTALDAAAVIRDLGFTRNDLVRAGINLNRGNLGADSFAISKLPKEWLDEVGSGRIRSDVAAAIAEGNLPDNLRDGLITAARSLTSRFQGEEAVLIARRVGTATNETQGSMFEGFDDVPIAQISKLAEALDTRLSRNANRFSQVATGQESAGTEINRSGQRYDALRLRIIRDQLRTNRVMIEAIEEEAKNYAKRPTDEQFKAASERLYKLALENDLRTNGGGSVPTDFIRPENEGPNTVRESSESLFGSTEELELTPPPEKGNRRADPVAKNSKPVQGSMPGLGDETGQFGFEDEFFYQEAEKKDPKIVREEIDSELSNWGDGDPDKLTIEDKDRLWRFAQVYEQFPDASGDGLIAFARRYPELDRFRDSELKDAWHEATATGAMEKKSAPPKVEATPDEPKMAADHLPAVESPVQESQEVRKLIEGEDPPEDEGIGSQKRSTQALALKYGFPEFTGRGESYESMIAAGRQLNGKSVVDDLNQNPRLATSAEEVAIAIRMAELDGHLDRLGQDLERAVSDGNKDAIARITADREDTLRELQEAAFASVQGGTAWSNSGRARQLLARQSSDGVSLVRRALTSLKRKLTTDETEALLKAGEKYDLVAKELEALQERFAKLAAEKAVGQRRTRPRAGRTVSTERVLEALKTLGSIQARGGAEAIGSRKDAGGVMIAWQLNKEMRLALRDIVRFNWDELTEAQRSSPEALEHLEGKVREMLATNQVNVNDADLYRTISSAFVSGTEGDLLIQANARVQSIEDAIKSEREAAKKAAAEGREALRQDLAEKRKALKEAEKAQAKAETDARNARRADATFVFKTQFEENVKRQRQAYKEAQAEFEKAEKAEAEAAERDAKQARRSDATEAFAPERRTVSIAHEVIDKATDLDIDAVVKEIAEKAGVEELDAANAVAAALRTRKAKISRKISDTFGSDVDIHVLLSEHPELRDAYSELRKKRIALESQAAENNLIIMELEQQQRIVRDSTIAAFGNNAWVYITDARKVVRRFKTTFDNSIPGRQGFLVLTRHPKIWSQAMGASLKAMGSEKGMLDMYEKYLYEDYDLLDLARASNLDVTALGGLKEENFEVGVFRDSKLVKTTEFAERAATIAGSVMRLQLFKHLIMGMEMRGTPITLAEAKALATHINTISGRGDLKSSASAGNHLTAFFLGPRWAKSRLDVAFGAPYALLRREKGMTPRVKKEIGRTMAQYWLVVGATVALARLMGFNVETDWRATDFLKISIPTPNGVRVYDLSGGTAVYIRMIARIGVATMNAFSDSEDPEDRIWTDLFPRDSEDIHRLKEESSELNWGDRLIGDKDEREGVARPWYKSVIREVGSKLSPELAALAPFGMREFGEPRTPAYTKTDAGRQIYQLPIPINVNNAIEDLRNKANWGEVASGFIPDFFGVGSQFRDFKSIDEMGDTWSGYDVNPIEDVKKHVFKVTEPPVKN